MTRLQTCLFVAMFVLLSSVVPARTNEAFGSIELNNFGGVGRETIEDRFAALQLVHNFVPGRLTVQNLLAVVAKTLSTPARIGGSGFIAFGEASAVAGPRASVGEPSGHFAIPAGDLTGDGRDDAIDYTVEAGASIVRAIDGRDGSNLWRRDLSAFLEITKQDVTGDGLDELVLYEVGPLHPAQIAPGVQHVAELNWPQTLTVLRSSDGHALWSKRVDATVVVAQAAPPAPAGAFVSAIRSLIFDVDVSDDATGDGKPDVFTLSIEAGPAVLAASLAGGVGAGGSLVTGAFLDGTSGSETISVTDQGNFMQPISDVSGDGLADLSHARGLPVESIAITSASGGIPYWIVPGRYLFAIPFHADGDAIPEVLLIGPGGSAVVRARTGHVEWAVTYSDLCLPWVAGDHDQVIGTDVIQVCFGFIFEDDAFIDVVQWTARSGILGAVLWTSEMQFRQHEGVSRGLLSAYCCADFSADGVPDVMAFALAEVCDESACLIRSSRAAFVDGTDGSSLWGITDDDASDGMTLAGPLVRDSFRQTPADIDGDGAHDIGIVSVEFGASWRLSFTGHSGVNGAALFGRVFDEPLGGIVLAFGAGDFAGDTADELLVSILDEDGDPPARSVAFSATDTIWSLPAPL